MEGSGLKLHGRGRSLLAALIALGVAGCSSGPTSEPKSGSVEVSKPVAEPAPEPKLERVSDRPANPLGKVLVLEYHRVLPKEARWDRSIARFRADLERLYKMGFRPVTASEFLGNRMKLAPGASPVVMTFDDSDPSQIRFKDDGSLDPNSAVGIWAEFAKKHPDFPVKGTFYVLPNLWGQPKWVSKKVEFLRAQGSELGSHTLTHGRLNRMTDEQAKAELGGAMELLAKHGQDEVSIALPYGISPKNRELLKEFAWKGKSYKMTGAFLVGAEPSPSPEDPKFNPFRVPRVQAIEGPQGITYWLDLIEKGKVGVYVAG